jgi:hypothetical protein
MNAAEADRRITSGLTVLTLKRPGYGSVMSFSIWLALASALGSLLSAVVAAFAAFASRTAACQANEAATRASAAADIMAQIEQQRRHSQLTPKFRIRCQVQEDWPDPGFAILFVMLAGGELEALDTVTVTILNTAEIRPWGLPDNVTVGEAEEVLWSGWEFDTFFTGGAGKRALMASSHRQSKPRPFSRRDGKDWCQVLLRRTAPPTWQNWTREEWQAKWETFPLRLSLDCHAEGHRPWTVYQNVKIEPSQPGTPSP